MGAKYMKISFLVTYYNQKDYVKQSLDSILAIEKPCDWEIVVGDDGSTDGTIDVVNEYVKLYPDNIKLYVMPRELGKKYDSVIRASANRINILEHSTGDFFCTLDGDDYYCDTHFVKEAIGIFEKYTDITAVAFGFRYFNEDKWGDINILPEEFTNKIIDKRTYLKNYYLHAGAFVYKKNYDNSRIEYIKKLCFFDDNNIVINCLNYGGIYVVNRYIYAYRQTGESVYTSMNQLEQAVLNVQGMDVDIRLIGEGFKDDVIERYSTAVILMYIWRNKIRSVLGEDKYNRYTKGCESLKPSYCYKLMNYAELEGEKRDIRLFVKKLMRKKKKYTLKQYIKYFFRRTA